MCVFFTRSNKLFVFVIVIVYKHVWIFVITRITDGPWADETCDITRDTSDSQTLESRILVLHVGSVDLKAFQLYSEQIRLSSVQVNSTFVSLIKGRGAIQTNNNKYKDIK
jgi:hypothetical protein